MILPALWHGTAICLFVVAVVHAALGDRVRRRVANATVLALLLGYLPLALGVGLAWVVILTSIAAAALVFVIGFAAFCAGWIGGGDVRLAAVATLWIGAGLVVPYLLLAAVFGALLAVLMLGLRRWQARADADANANAEAPLPEAIPFGPGLVLAAFVLFANSPWFVAS